MKIDDLIYELLEEPVVQEDDSIVFTSRSIELIHKIVVFCGINEKRIEQKTMNENEKSEKCPLQDLPERKKENKYHNATEKGYVSGYNSCINEILKGSDKK